MLPKVWQAREKSIRAAGAPKEAIGSKRTASLFLWPVDPANQLSDREDEKSDAVRRGRKYKINIFTCQNKRICIYVMRVLRLESNE
jgi:hypothetical protein